MSEENNRLWPMQRNASGWITRSPQQSGSVRVEELAFA